MAESRLFLTAFGNRTRNNGLKLEYRKHNTSLQKNFMVRVMEHWNRLPRQVVESTSMEVFKTYLDAYLIVCNLL